MSGRPKESGSLHGVPQAAFDAACALIEEPDLDVHTALRWLPKPVVAAARKVCDQDAFFVELARQWPWLVQAARVDDVFRFQSRSSHSHLKPLQDGVKKLAAFRAWMNAPAGGLGEDRVGLITAYMMARADGLIDCETVTGQIERDIEAVERLDKVLRHFSGVEDRTKRSKTFWPALARCIWDLHQHFELGDPVRTVTSVDVGLMTAIATEIGIKRIADSPLKYLCQASS